MFGDVAAFSSFSTNDVAAAKKFYGDDLGINVSDEMMGLELRFANGHRVYIYPKEDHVPATYTVLNFPVNDIEKAVAALAAKGVTFESYEGADDKGIHRDDQGPAIAWFKDPAGNFVSILSELEDRPL
jgi:predicted enzyme related to lactoylglutathione lyase